MRALVKAKAEPGLWMEEQPEPTIGPNDLKIQVRRTAICGTDLHIHDWDTWAQRTVQPPVVIGHEFMGTVVERGSHVAGFEVGDRVSGEGHITCGHCRNCRAGKRHLCRNTVGVGVHRAGAFAEFMVIPATNAFKLPDAVTDEVAAILDPLGNAVHTALSFDLVGEDVLITGAGPIGCMAVAIARHVGARHIVITDLNAFRLDMARKMGASQTVHGTEGSLSEAMANLGMTEGFDVGMEMSGHGAALRDLIDHMNHGGRVALLGIPSEELSVDWSDIVLKGLVLKGIYGREMFETWYKMAALIQGGLDVSPLITHVMPAHAFRDAFDTVRSGQAGKVVLDWTV